MQFKPLIFLVVLCAIVSVAGKMAFAGQTVTIVGFGDSLMAGFQLAGDEAFPAKLEARLREQGHQVSVINAGVSGDTTSGGLSRLDWSVPEDAKLVVLELGANDALRGIMPNLTRENLDSMILRLKERGISVILAGMQAPPNMGNEYEKSFNAIFPDLAKKYDVPLIGFFLEGVAANPALLLADGMHPNPSGVDQMVENALPVVEQWLMDLEQ